MIHVPGAVSDLSLLLIRLIVGFAFITASRNKARHLEKFAKKHDISLSLARFIMAAEMAGGIGILLGILSQWAALGLMLLMLGTMRLHIFKWKSPYWAEDGGWEYDLMLFALASVILVHGAGGIAV